MSTANRSLQAFAVADGLLFLRSLAQMLVLVGMVALPAAVVVLGLIPEMVDYLIVSMSSLMLVLLGAWDLTSDEGSEESIEIENSRQAVIVITVSYTTLAGTYSPVLVVSAALGFGAAQLGFPTVGLILAAVYPYLDKWLAGVDERLSVANLGGNSIAILLRGFTVLCRVPGSLGDEARNHRRYLY